MRLLLDKIKFIGGIDPLITPRCVLVDICLSSGMARELVESKTPRFLIKDLEKTVFVSIDTEDIDIKTCSEIARYINADEEDWENFNLMRAFISFINFDPDQYVSGKTKFGRKTNSEPENCDECCTYLLLKKYSIPMNPDMTFEEMIEEAKKIPNLDSSLKHYLSKKILKTQKPLHKIYEYISNVNLSVCEFFHPYDDNQAQVFSVYIYYIDISFSKDCIAEFIELRCNNGRDYIPVDPKFRYFYSLNPEFFNTKKRWNPKFQFIYKSREILGFARAEGYIGSNSGNALNYLNDLYSENTFYSGIHPFAKKYTPIEMENIADCISSECVSFGSENNFVVYKHSELLEYFTRRGYFFNPYDSSIFSDKAIKRLEYILANNSSGSKLLEYIRAIKRSYQTLNSGEIEWLTYYNSISDNEKCICQEILTKILELGMYMRGWKVSSDTYPLSSSDCMVEPSQIYVRDYNVSIAYNDLDQCSLEYENISKVILNLPLLQYRDGKFIQSDTSEHGFTIKDRLDIVRNDEDNIYACVRMSSNYICASCFRYMSMVQIEPGFDIKLMRDIT